MTFKEPYNQYIGQVISRFREMSNSSRQGVIIKASEKRDNTLLIHMIDKSSGDSTSLDQAVLTRNKLGEYEDANISVRKAGSILRHLAIRGTFEIPHLAKTKL